MNTTIQIATWNIGGGIDNFISSQNPQISDQLKLLSNTSRQFANVLKTLDLDFLCLQEVHLGLPQNHYYE